MNLSYTYGPVLARRDCAEDMPPPQSPLSRKSKQVNGHLVVIDGNVVWPNFNRRKDRK